MKRGVCAQVGDYADGERDEAEELPQSGKQGADGQEEVKDQLQDKGCAEVAGGKEFHGQPRWARRSARRSTPVYADSISTTDLATWAVAI
jgi:hypothetical protein